MIMLLDRHGKILSSTELGQVAAALLCRAALCFGSCTVLEPAAVRRLKSVVILERKAKLISYFETQLPHTDSSLHERVQILPSYESISYHAWVGLR